VKELGDGGAVFIHVLPLIGQIILFLKNLGACKPQVETLFPCKEFNTFFYSFKN